MKRIKSNEHIARYLLAAMEETLNGYVEPYPGFGWLFFDAVRPRQDGQKIAELIMRGVINETNQAKVIYEGN